MIPEDTRVSSPPRRHRLLRSGRTVAAGLLACCAALPATAPAAEPPLQVDRYADTYDQLFRHYAKRFFGPFVDWRWFKAQAVAESMLQKDARSGPGARGLMQLMPATFAEIRSENPQFGDIENPRWNIAAGIYYNRELYRKWRSPATEQERFYFALGSYNAGYGRILQAFRRAGKAQRWDAVQELAPRETQLYVARIRALMADDEQQPAVARLEGVERFVDRSLALARAQ